MKLAILGGSFNPIHQGHLFLADSVLSELHYDRVVLVPAYRSPFKPAAPGMEDTARDRFEMIAASITGDHRLTVDDCELRREGVSYTVDTIADIIRRYAPDGKPGLIIGDDLAVEFPQWHKSEEVLAMADIIIARRSSIDTLQLPYKNIAIPNDIIAISSSEVRKKIATDEAWRCLVPAAARVIIEDRGLYGCGPHSRPIDNIQNLIFRVEETVRQDLSLERFLHSRNTALLSWDLCKRFEKAYRLDPEMGYLAGIAHDWGKPLNSKDMLKLVKDSGEEISPIEKEKPSLLHGKASAILLRERFNVHNEAVLEAIALHTSGSGNMGPLAKVVYIADKVEVSREKIDPALRKLAHTGDDLDKIFFAVLAENVSWLRSKKVALLEGTLSLLEKAPLEKAPFQEK